MPGMNTNQNLAFTIASSIDDCPRRIICSYHFEFKEEFTRRTALVMLFD